MRASVGAHQTHVVSPLASGSRLLGAGTLGVLAAVALTSCGGGNTAAAAVVIGGVVWWLKKRSDGKKASGTAAP
jgi:hypothetical protein